MDTYLYYRIARRLRNCVRSCAVITTDELLSVALLKRSTPMLDIGIVGLDTSHAESFASVIDETSDMTVAGVWDGAVVRDQEYRTTFCEEHDTEQCSLSTLVDRVDAAMVLTVNWETHQPLATRFLNAGIPTFIDKPLAGCQSDIDAIAAATKTTPLSGGSALPFHPDIAALPCDDPNRTVFAAGYNDFFYYRVHLVDTVRHLADADWVSVRLSDGPGTTVDISFENGTHATIRFDGSPDSGTFSVLDVGTRTRTVELGSNSQTLAEMYRPLVESFRMVVRGSHDDTAQRLDAGTLLLAVEAAIDEDRTITPESESIDTVAADGERFLAQYEPYY